MHICQTKYWPLLVCGVLLLFVTLLYRVAGRTFSHNLTDHVLRKPPGSIDINQLTTFAWDRMFVFGPYTPRERIHATLGSYWNDANRTSIEHSDSITLVVFLRNGEVVYWCEHPRDKGDLTSIALPQGYSPEEAHFQVRLDGQQRAALYKADADEDSSRKRTGGHERKGDAAERH